MTDVAVIGLGKLGLCMAAAIASKGNRVIGVDVMPEWAAKINVGGCPVNEPGLGAMLAPLVAKGRIRCTTDYSDAVEHSSISFVAVNTPLDPDNTMNMDQIRAASVSLGKALRKTKKFHIVAVSSTILPMTCDRIMRPILERESGKRCGKDFGLVANPVFIALTTVVRDYTRPPFVIVGSYDRRSGDAVHRFYGGFCEGKPPIVRTTPVMGEMIKFAHNAFMTTKISFINEMSDICARLPGGDARVLREFFSVGGDRPGRFFMPGLGFGGPCFPKDLRTFITFGKEIEFDSMFLRMVNDCNTGHAKKIVDAAEEAAGRVKGKRVAILGLAYKPRTDIVENSFSFILAGELRRRGAAVTVHDPHAARAARPYLKETVRYADDVGDALKGADLCVVATAQDEFRSIPPSIFLRNMKRAAVVDVWGIYPAETFRKKMKVYTVIGVSQA